MHFYTVCVDYLHRSIAPCFVGETIITFSTTMYYPKMCSRLLERHLLRNKFRHFLFRNMFPVLCDPFSKKTELLLQFALALSISWIPWANLKVTGLNQKRAIKLFQIGRGEARTFGPFSPSQVLLLTFR